MLEIYDFDFEQAVEEVSKLLDNKEYHKLKAYLGDLNPADIASLLAEIPEEKLPVVFRLLGKDPASETFVEMDPDGQETLIKSFSDKELKEIIDNLFVDDTVDIIEEMPANVVRRILANTNPQTRKEINEILKYPEDSAGAIMTTEYVWLRKDSTVQEAFQSIRKFAVDKETIYTCYVIDQGRHLEGVVSVKELLLSDYSARISDIMETNVISFGTLDDQELVAQAFDRYNYLAMPVVDTENRLVGIITIDDAMDVLREEQSEDIAKMNAIVPSDKPYLKRNVFEIWKERIPWLLLLLVSATFTGLIINTYETKLSALSPLLFACVPMLMDTGGNAGSQASVTIIRGLALNELDFSDIFRIVWKEFRASVLLALTLSVVCWAKLILIDNLIFGYDYTYLLSAVVSVALFLTVLVAKFVGCMLPLIAKKLKLDPAVVASPFITTIVDAVSLIIYCKFAIAILA
ncbi:MAG TPA: magnesium transporter [Clostridiales bacterium]|nr:magnesium transporter [Clostridiales bacterium]